MEKKKKTSNEKELKNWKTATIILGVLFVLSLMTNGFSLSNDNDDATVEKDDAAKKDADVNLQQTIKKSDKPIVELFVMSHCPYGTQAEKGILPVADLLGDKIDFEVKYVYYAMHGKIELDEQLKQYCIQKEQNPKFFDYLVCFLDGGDDKAEDCLNSVEVDKDKLDSCIEKTDNEFSVSDQFNDKATWLSGRFPLFGVHKDLNEKYGIRGSPSLVINGEQVQSNRSPEAYLSAICGAFNKVPKECNEKVDAAAPSPGFGFKTTGGATAGGGCGG
jgi:glutaredoxin